MNRHLFTADRHVYNEANRKLIIKWLSLLMVVLLLILFAPWTQNIRSRGSVTTLKQEQRPQQVNALIAGKIDRWYVKEGDVVKSGDTILKLAEIKAEYLDPLLVQRTGEQVQAKYSSVDFNKRKVDATDAQLGALSNLLNMKLMQLDNKYKQVQVKIQSDSMDLIAATNEWRIAAAQFNRQQTLYDSGLVSLTQLEQRNQALQSATAKKMSAENLFIASKQELAITKAEFDAIRQEYTEKRSKAEAERFSALSSIAQGEAELTKLQNQFDNYSIRNDMYYVLAPQSGQIINAQKSGIGETVSEGDLLVSIVPQEVDYAVEMYVRPVDLPLVSAGQKVRFLFDGFPAIVFSGWPNASYGTYQGLITAVENDRSENGMFRVLVKEDATFRKWPEELKVGTGASGIALLKTVAVWYELWRMINGFPKDYYKPKARNNRE
jgi:multidrug efflux pump subunit AcrA (membrane-fusion protein)